MYFTKEFVRELCEKEQKKREYNTSKCAHLYAKALGLQRCRWHKQCRWRAGRLAGDGGRGQSGRGHPARIRRWAVQVGVFTLHTGAGWAWWRVSVRTRLGVF